MKQKAMGIGLCVAMLSLTAPGAASANTAGGADPVTLNTTRSCSQPHPHSRTSPNSRSRAIGKLLRERSQSTDTKPIASPTSCPQQRAAISMRQ